MLCGSKHAHETMDSMSVFSGVGINGMPAGVGSGVLEKGGDVVAAAVRQDHLENNQVLNILKVLQPYDDNLNVATKNGFNVNDGLGALRLNSQDSAEIASGDLIMKTGLDVPAGKTVSSLDRLREKLNAAQSFRGELKGPALNDLPYVNLNKPSTDARAEYTLPSLAKAGPDLNGTLAAPAVSLATPQLNSHNASLGIDGSAVQKGTLKYDAPPFTMPKFDLPQVQTPEVDGELYLPSVHKEIDLNLPSPKLDFTSPNAALNGPKLDLRGPDVDLQAPNAALNGPKLDLRGPDVDLQAPNADLRLSPDKIKWPHLKWKGPKVKGPEAALNADLHTPDLSTPDIHLPKGKLKGPYADVQAPNLDLGAPSGKINWPHLKWKKPRLHGTSFDAELNSPDMDVSVPRLKGGIKAPDFDVNLPKADLKGPDLDIQRPHLEAPSGRINWPHLKWKKPKVKGPKADLDIDAGLKTPELLTPNFESDINGQLRLPTADVKGPNLDVDTPNLDIDSPSGKINWSPWKWKKHIVPDPKIDMDLKTDLSSPDVDLSIPSIEGGINTPDLNLPRADIDVNTPDVDIGAPSGRLKFPTLKKPKLFFSGHQLKTPSVDLDTDLKTPDLNLSAQKLQLNGPDLNLPNADVDGIVPDLDASGKIKWPTFKRPKWSVSGPKVNGPDIDANVSTPDLNLTGPKIDGEIHTPDLKFNTPKAELDGPMLDINADAPSGIFKWFKKPKIGTLKGLSSDVDADLKVPDLDLSVPDVNLNAPHVGLSTPTIEAPDLRGDLKSPHVDLHAPDLNLEQGDAKVVLPKINFPKWPKVKDPQLDTSLPNINIDAPNVDLKSPNLQGNLGTPDIDLGLPKGNLQTPELDVSTKRPTFSKIQLPTVSGPQINKPNLDVDADLKVPNMDLSAPHVGLSTPKIEPPDFNAILKSPQVDLPAHDLNVEQTETKGVFPKLKLPKWPKVKDSHLDTNLPNIDIDAPDVDLKAPNLQGSLGTPDIDLGLPKGNLQTPELDVSTGRPTFPKIQLPNFSEPKIEKPNLDVDADFKGQSVGWSAPDVDLSAPHVGLSTPKIEPPALNAVLKSPQVDPNLNVPTFLGPKYENPNLDADLKVADLDLSAPHVGLLSNSDLKGMDASLKTPDLNFDSRQGDFQLPHYKLPKLDLSSPEVEFPSIHPSIQAGMETPKVNIGTPKADANISAPTVDVSGPMITGDLKGPQVDMAAPKLDANLEKPKFPHMKFPKMSFSGPKTKTVEVDTSPKLSPVTVSAPEINKPGVQIKAGEDAEVKGSPKSKLKWPFKWGFKSSSDMTDEEGGGPEAPVFRLHNLPNNAFEEKEGQSKLDNEAKDYIISKGIRLPVVNVPSRNGEKIDIMERLRMAKEKVPSTNVSPTEEKNLTLKIPAPDLDATSASILAEEPNLFRGGTFKVDKPQSPLGLFAPEVSSSDESDKLSLSLSNMLGLNVK
nr:neuroblast differentiation-associated protein AHNAK-like [Nerophis lumbriciformis]